MARAVRPDLPNDPRHKVVEPSLEEIAAALRQHGHSGEAELWQAALARAPRAAA
jgi:hypothetical protein